MLKTEVPNELLEGLAVKMRPLSVLTTSGMPCSLNSCLIILTTVLLLLCPLGIFLTKGYFE